MDKWACNFTATIEAAGDAVFVASSRSLQAEVYQQMWGSEILMDDSRSQGLSITPSAYKVLLICSYEMAFNVLYADQHRKREIERSLHCMSTTLSP